MMYKMGVKRIWRRILNFFSEFIFEVFKWEYESCKDCGNMFQIMWDVDDDIWEKVMYELGRYDNRNTAVCLDCFVKRSKVKGIDIKPDNIRMQIFYPEPILKQKPPTDTKHEKNKPIVSIPSIKSMMIMDITSTPIEIITNDTIGSLITMTIAFLFSLSIVALFYFGGICLSLYETFICSVTYAYPFTLFCIIFSLCVIFIISLPLIVHKLLSPYIYKRQ